MSKGKVNLIEVLPYSDEEDELEHNDGELHRTELEQLPERATIATLTGVPPNILLGSGEVFKDIIPLL